MSSINIKLYYYRNGERAQVTDIRRLRVQETVSYEELANKIAESQDWVKNGNVSFKYIDEENDLVQFSSNEEWQIALEVLKIVNGNKLLRVRVAAPEQVQREERRHPWEQYRHGGWRRRHCPFFARCESRPSQVPDFQNIINSAQPFIEGLINNLQGKQQESQPNASAPLVRHFGIICDGCEQQNFTGDRFKCNDCKDFDFCGACFSNEELRKIHGDHAFTKISKPVNRCQRQAPPSPQAFDFSSLFSQFQEQAQGFDLSNVLNHPLAQQFVSQLNEEQAQQKIGDLVNQFQPILTELAQVFAGVAEEKPAQEPQSAPVQPSAPQESQPAEEHVEEIIIDDDEPQVAPSQVFPYQVQLEQLTSMGFTDVEKIKNLLVQYSGNCGQVVTVLCK